MWHDDGLSDNMRIASALSTRLLSSVPDPYQGRGRQKRPVVTLSSGPLSAERATRNGVCATAHTKSAGILSGAHRRASVDARSRRTPALHSSAEASFDCGRLVRPGPSSSRPPPSAQDASAGRRRAWFL